jgi:hypothetical protein
MSSAEAAPERERSPSKLPYVPTAALDAVCELKECKPLSSSGGAVLNIAGASYSACACTPTRVITDRAAPCRFTGASGPPALGEGGHSRANIRAAGGVCE